MPPRNYSLRCHLRDTTWPHSRHGQHATSNPTYRGNVALIDGVFKERNPLPCIGNQYHLDHKAFLWSRAPCRNATRRANDIMAHAPLCLRGELSHTEGLPCETTVVISGQKCRSFPPGVIETERLLVSKDRAGMGREQGGGDVDDVFTISPLPWGLFPRRLFQMELFPRGLVPIGLFPRDPVRFAFYLLCTFMEEESSNCFLTVKYTKHEAGLFVN